MTTTITLKGNLTKTQAKALGIDLDTLVPGESVSTGKVSVRVSAPQVSDIRQFAIDNDIPVGKRGRYSRTLIDAFDAHNAKVASRAAAVAKGQATRAANKRAAAEAEASESVTV